MKKVIATEEDYYEQGFEMNGVVSIWVGQNDNSNDDELDVLHDLCGVGYYEIDNQESNCFDFEMVCLHKLLEEMSYSSSFIEEAIKAAFAMGITDCRWITVQFDFSYDQTRVKRAIAKNPVFIGVFEYFKI